MPLLVRLLNPGFRCFMAQRHCPLQLFKFRKLVARGISPVNQNNYFRSLPWVEFWRSYFNPTALLNRDGLPNRFGHRPIIPRRLTPKPRRRRAPPPASPADPPAAQTQSPHVSPPPAQDSEA